MVKYKRRWLTAICAVFLFVVMSAVPVLAESGNTTDRSLPLLVDDAGLLSEEEADGLETKLEEISKKQECEVAVVTVNSLEGKSVTDYTDDFYDNNGYGYGNDDSGIMLLVAMEDREWHISTYGYGITAFTDAGLEYIEEKFKPSLSDGEYADAFSEYADLCDAFLTQAKTGKPYDTGNMPRDSVSPIWIPGSLLIGAVVAFILGSIKKSRLKSVRKQTEATEYTKPGSVVMTSNWERMVNRTITTRVIKKENGGGSSTHSSSSGRQHGGKSGSF